MKTISKFLFFAMILTAVACTNTDSNERSTNGDSNPASGKNSSVEDTSNKDSGAKPESEPASANSALEKDAKNSPAELVEQLYKQHDTENSPFFQDKNRELVDKFFVKSLADMIWKDSVESKDEIGALEFDPLYNAQDTEIADFKVGKPAIQGEQAAIEVTFLNFGEEQKIKYSLTKENGTWKIENIDYGDASTLVKVFKENGK